MCAFPASRGPARVSLERSVSELSLDWVDWATVCSMAACVLVGPVDPLTGLLFERAVSVSGVGTAVPLPVGYSFYLITTS